MEQKYLKYKTRLVKPIYSIFGSTTLSIDKSTAASRRIFLLMLDKLYDLNKLNCFRMKKLLFINIFWIFNAIIQAQEFSGGCYKSSEESMIFDECLVGTTIISPKLYIGDPFYTPNWSKGWIKLENNHVLNDKILKYNALMDELFWLRDADYLQIIVKKETVKEFYYNLRDSAFLFKKLLIKPFYQTDSIYSYLQVLAEGSINFYVKREVLIKKGTNELYSNNFYYIQSQGNILKGFIPSRRMLLKLVGMKRDMMRTIIKSEKLKIRKEGHLIRAITKFNSIK